MQEEKIIDQMMEIGINKYEAKAYLSLLKNPDVTAYELSKLSGVPQAKIYETMNKLMEKKLVNIVGEDPVKYVAVEFDGYLSSYKHKVSQNVEFLKENMSKIDTPTKVSFMLHIDGLDNVMTKLLSILKNAKKSVYIEAWSEEFELIYNKLSQLEERGVEVCTVVLGNTELKVGKMHYHEMDGMVDDAEDFGRWLTIIVDGREALFATVKGDSSQAIWTENKAFMLMAKSLITHDIFLSEIYNKYRRELDKEFGPNMKKIREKINI